MDTSQDFSIYLQKAKSVYEDPTNTLEDRIAASEVLVARMKELREKTEYQCKCKTSLLNKMQARKSTRQQSRQEPEQFTYNHQRLSLESIMFEEKCARLMQEYECIQEKNGMKALQMLCKMSMMENFRHLYKQAGV